jgi:hypothetical protein
MREMAIPPFPRKFENPDLGNLLRTRLSQKVVLWPDQAIPLAGYICHPNDPAAREELLGTLKSWSDGSETVPPHLGRIQHEWLRVADVLHHCTDLIDGQHQKKRGGPSIGKAIALVEGKAKRRGTGAANLWKRWKRYKDVAHLATAAVLICGEARTRSAGQSFGPFGLSSDQLGPFPAPYPDGYRRRHWPSQCPACRQPGESQSAREYSRFGSGASRILVLIAWQA